MENTTVVKKKKKLNIANIIRLFAIGILLYAVFLNITVDDLSDKYILGLKPIVVKSDTMEPHIKDGSIVIIKKTTTDKLRDLDVVSYEIEDRNIVHRVFKDDKGNIKTKADVDQKFDSYKITDEELQGVVVLRVNLPIFKSLEIAAPDENEPGQSVDDVDI